MKAAIATTALVIAMATPAIADNRLENNQYYLEANSLEQTAECSNTDAAIGIGAGIAGSILLGIGVVATSPLVGPGVAAGSTVGWSGALSAPFITGSTASAVGWSTVITGPMLATVGYYGGCAVGVFMD